MTSYHEECLERLEEVGEQLDGGWELYDPPMSGFPYIFLKNGMDSVSVKIEIMSPNLDMEKFLCHVSAREFKREGPNPEKALERAIETWRNEKQEAAEQLDEVENIVLQGE